MSQFNAPAYDIERPTGQCAFAGRELAVGETYIACLVEYEPSEEGDKPPSKAADLGLKRLDISQQVWDQGQRPDRLFSYWKSTVPQPNTKKKLFVDDQVLLALFRRLGDEEQAERAAFRFVLCLVLMRKRLLRYDRTEQRGEESYWLVTARGDDEPMAVLDPQLTEEQVQEVTEQLGDILEGEL